MRAVWHTAAASAFNTNFKAGRAAAHARILLGAEPPLPPMTQIAFSFTAPSNLQHSNRCSTAARQACTMTTWASALTLEFGMRSRETLQKEMHIAAAIDRMWVGR